MKNHFLRVNLSEIEIGLKSIVLPSLLAILLAGLIGRASPVLAQRSPEDFSEVDAYITETMQSLPIKGLALAIVKGDQILYLKGYGTANTRGDPVTPQTPFMMGSVTKSFTALAAHQLALAGKLNLDASLQTYIPEFRLADPQAASIITVRHVLVHTSGISSTEGEAPYLESSKTTFAEALDRLAHYRPARQPGGQYEYSNWNYILLAQVIARASGQPYVEYVQENILDPLEMSQATFADYHGLPQAASGHTISYGVSVPYDEPYLPVTFGAAGLTASVEDLAHYLIPFFNQGEYKGHSLLPARGQGWFDTFWNWHSGQPGNLNWGHSGGHIATQANLQLLTANQDQVGVALLMNTRLDAPFPAPQAYQISMNVGRIALGLPSEHLPSRELYTAWILYDGVLLLVLAGLLWQAVTLKGWRSPSEGVRLPKRILAWTVIVFDLLICLGIGVLPSMAHSRWEILLSVRPDFALPLLILALGLGAVGLIKVALGYLAAGDTHRWR